MQFTEEEFEKMLEQISNDKVVADSVYEFVISQLHIDSDNTEYRNLVLGMLKRQTTDHLVFSIWHHLDEAQALHFKDYMRQTQLSDPSLPHEAILMEFALLYPDLERKVLDGLTHFFEGFVTRFNDLTDSL